MTPRACRALNAAPLAWRAMTAADLPLVAAIDPLCYSHPWNQRQFEDSLASGHRAMVGAPVDAPQDIVAYHVAMEGADEWHLLNLTVRPDAQGRGHARTMLAQLGQHLQGLTPRPKWLWLEVRQSNARALALYRRWGFEQVSVRPRYYPITVFEREAAVVMRWAVPPPEDSPHAVD